MTTRGYGGITIGLTPLCRVLKRGTKVRCMRIGPAHEGDHGNDYIGESGTTWPRRKDDRT